ncbi:MAG: DUF1700 domain-containing protein [Clostridia bacterium]|nr:DUF1700 domain-containing protein [Clostridia bacterium]
MRKSEFLAELRNCLHGLPEEDIQSSLDYYAEMIDDRTEEAGDEEAAVAGVGTPWAVAAEIRNEKHAEATNEKTTEKEPEKEPERVEKTVKEKRRLSPLVIVLLILGSPIWISLLVAAFSIVIAVYAVLWSAIVCLWSVVVALGASAIAGILYLPYYAVLGRVWVGIALAGAGLFTGGLGVFAFLGSLSATKGMAILSKQIFRFIRFCFVGRRGSK